jgi:hypothetical protein
MSIFPSPCTAKDMILTLKSPLPLFTVQVEWSHDRAYESRFGASFNWKELSEDKASTVSRGGCRKRIKHGLIIAAPPDLVSNSLSLYFVAISIVSFQAGSMLLHHLREERQLPRILYPGARIHIRILRHDRFQRPERSNRSPYSCLRRVRFEADGRRGRHDL